MKMGTWVLRGAEGRTLDLRAGSCAPQFPSSYNIAVYYEDRRMSAEGGRGTPDFEGQGAVPFNFPLAYDIEVYTNIFYYTGRKDSQ